MRENFHRFSVQNRECRKWESIQKTGEDIQKRNRNRLMKALWNPEASAMIANRIGMKGVDGLAG